MPSGTKFDVCFFNIAYYTASRGMIAPNIYPYSEAVQKPAIHLRELNIRNQSQIGIRINSC